MDRKQSLAMIGLATLMLAFSVTFASADTIKTLHIKLPAGLGDPANDMHVTFFNIVKNVPNNPRGTKQDRLDDPSDTFDGAKGVGTRTLNFAGGSLASGNQMVQTSSSTSWVTSDARTEAPSIARRQRTIAVQRFTAPS